MAAAKMEEDTAVKTAAAADSPRLNGGGGNHRSLSVVKDNDESAKRQWVDRCYSFMMEVKMEPAGLKSLKHLHSKKFKLEIKRWAKAVVRYARQVSDHFGSSRR